VYIDYATLETCSAAIETVIVVDVWRSFTTTAYAFAAGVREILVAETVQEAFELRQRFPGALLAGMGTLGGQPAEGFDYGNSPAEMMEGDFRGRRLILCTPNGAPGLARSVNAQALVAGSFVCAAATARFLQQQAPDQVTFVCTEAGIEDQVYTEYMTALLQGETLNSVGMLENIRQAALQHGRSLVDRGRLSEAQLNTLTADLDCCLALDRFDYAMPVERRDGLLVMEARTC